MRIQGLLLSLVCLLLLQAGTVGQKPKVKMKNPQIQLRNPLSDDSLKFCLPDSNIPIETPKTLYFPGVLQAPSLREVEPNGIVLKADPMVDPKMVFDPIEGKFYDEKQTDDKSTDSKEMLKLVPRTK